MAVFLYVCKFVRTSNNLGLRLRLFDHIVAREMLFVKMMTEIFLITSQYRQKNYSYKIPIYYKNDKKMHLGKRKIILPKISSYS